jgi:DHA3 family tetracycline resistance protein-like MFS transporter
MHAVLSSIYRIVSAGLDPFQLVVVGSVLEATTLLLEVPTGVVADLVGRRRSVVAGLALVGAGFLLEGWFASFLPILLAQVVWGAGFTLTSGADVAWIADEVGEARAARLYVRGAQCQQAGAFVGGAIGVLLGSSSLRLPIIWSGALLLLLAPVLAIVMPEGGFVRPERRARGRLRRSAGATLRAAASNARRRPILYLILAVAAFHGAASEGFDRLSDLRLLRSPSFPAPAGNLTSVALIFGGIYGASLLLAILATDIARRRVDVRSHRGLARPLAVINALLIASVVAFAVAESFGVAVASLLAAVVLREVQEPLTTAWINRDLDPRARATINSIAGQADALGQIAGGPAIGALAVARSVRAALVASGLLLLPAQALYARALRHGDATGP